MNDSFAIINSQSFILNYHYPYPRIIVIVILKRSLAFTA